jgi:Glycosyl hydrolase family 12
MLIRLSKSTLALVAATLIAACSNSDGSSVPGGSSNNNGNGNNGTGGNSIGIGTGNGAGSTGIAGTTGNASGGLGSGGLGSGGAAGVTSGGGSSGDGTGSLMSGGGYLVSGAWHGYVWTSASGTGSTISPLDFSMNTAGQPFCAMGTVAPMADYSGTAIVGYNLDQATGMNSATNTVVPSATGLVVNVANTGMSTLRVQLQGPNGATDATQRWCATITGTGGTIPYSSFNTACWDGTGTAYAGQPIVAAQILVPGDNLVAVPYNFCLNSISDGPPVVVTGGGGAGSGGAGAGGAGTAGAATGGAAGAGTAGAATGGAAGAPGPDNGYETNGAWKGYAFTATAGTGTTISPANFALVKSNAPLCATGTVGNTTASVAIVGINLNQPEGVNPVAGTITPTLGGILVSVTNSGGTPLRLQIQGPTGATDATDRWCAPNPGTGGYIPWTAFNTACWDNSGTAYANQPIVSALVMVPGVVTGSTAFSYCVNSIGESNDPSSGGTTTGCSISTAPSASDGTGTLTGQFDARAVTGGGHNYYVQNNVWGDASSNQSVTFTGVSFVVNQQSASDPTNGHPVSFPSSFIGSNGGHATTGSNLPKAVSSLTTVPTAWSNNAGSVSGTYNAAYDVWFSSGSGGDNGANSPSGGYLMVWFYKPSSGGQPIGSVQASGVSISGSTWDIWYGGTQNGVPVISYVKTASTTSLSFDLNVFIKDAVANRPNTIKSGMALTNVFAGFEIWNGGAGLKTNNYCTIVN